MSGFDSFRSERNRDLCFDLLTEAKEALTQIAQNLNPDDENSYRGDDREGAMDTCYAIASRFIGKLEAANGRD